MAGRSLAHGDRQIAKYGLVVWIDEQARERDIAGRLAQDAALGGADSPASLPRQVLNGLKWRRMQESHRAAQGPLMERPKDAMKLTQETLDRLQQASQFHQQRAAKKA